MAFTEFPDHGSFSSGSGQRLQQTNVRWATPVTSFQRTALEDTGLSWCQSRRGSEW